MGNLGGEKRSTNQERYLLGKFTKGGSRCTDSCGCRAACMCIPSCLLWGAAVGVLSFSALSAAQGGFGGLKSEGWLAGSCGL